MLAEKLTAYYENLVYKDSIAPELKYLNAALHAWSRLRVKRLFFSMSLSTLFPGKRNCRIKYPKSIIQKLLVTAKRAGDEGARNFSHLLIEESYTFVY